ncbi:zinc ribbon domain-containing protein [Halegenticoccus soli]|uniref:zinc ribbon domain-containing protein n=1 Tax=Halegenticoccus soli TaxID=1985678 RepID=UPI000C6EE437|nr:zinc ribbon domain-containing protein [Halegenticoccus soli]
MDIWGWIVLYAVGLAVLQLLVYRYLWDRDEPFAEHGRPTSERDGADREVRDERGRRERARGEGPDHFAGTWWGTPTPESRPSFGAGGAEAGERRCPHCGAENEPDATFVFCRNCAQRLG